MSGSGVAREDRCPRGWCDGACLGADLTPLLAPALAWIWPQLEKAAERRGDLDLTTGGLTITIPASPAERAAVGSLLGGRPLGTGRTRQVDLQDFTIRLRESRGPSLTPGAVAAHALSRALAPRFRAKRARSRLDTELRQKLQLWVVDDEASGWARRARVNAPEAVWERLRNSRWVADLRKQDEPLQVLTDVLTVIAALSLDGVRIDRRALADAVLDHPHGLDDDRPVARFTTRFLLATGVVPRSLSRRRDIWEAAGVACDDVTGGLLVTGIAPEGWIIPDGAVLTLPPRELAHVRWPSPARAREQIFVTENPSVLAATADAIRTHGLASVRMMCTAGTPSSLELAAMARLAEARWQLHVRADFDPAGMSHMRAFMEAIPTAIPWRMGAADYEETVRRSPTAPLIEVDEIGETRWEPNLASAMKRHGIAGSEEALLPALLSDISELAAGQAQ